MDQEQVYELVGSRESVAQEALRLLSLKDRVIALLEDMVKAGY